MGSAVVNIKEVDLSTRVPSFPGVYGGIVIDAPFGPVEEPVLVTSDADLLKRFTPDETIVAGYSNAFYSALAFLQRSNKLWVVRAADTALYGGLAVNTTDGTTTPLVAVADPTAHTFAAEDSILLYGASPGQWSSKISLKITDYNDKESGSFKIEVFKTNNLNVVIEEFVCSKTVGAKDGYNRNMYIEDILLGSNYIRALDNTTVSTNPGDLATAIAMSAGTDGNTVDESAMELALDTLDNQDNIPLTLILDGGFADADYHVAINAICLSRKDCMGILSVPYADETNSNYISSITTYRNTTLNMNSSYCAIYSPHVKIYDKYTDSHIFVSPDGYAAAVISFTASNYEIWYPPAGYRRGALNINDLLIRYSQGERDLLYDIGVNPIKFTPGKGITVWGQKTLSVRPSALDRVNVRLLLVVIEPAIGEALEDFLFEINDSATRSIITSIIQSYMEDIKSRRGVTDFQVVCDDSNNSPEDIDAHRLNVWLLVKPIMSVEYINFVVAITRTGMSFSAAAESL